MSSIDSLLSTLWYSILFLFFFPFPPSVCPQSFSVANMPHFCRFQRFRHTGWAEAIYVKNIRCGQHPDVSPQPDKKHDALHDEPKSCSNNPIPLLLWECLKVLSGIYPSTDIYFEKMCCVSSRCVFIYF